MDKRTAEKIINAFGKVLEETSNVGFGIPESLLPYKKDVIKQAIILSLQSLSSDDEDTRNLLEVGYTSLANFIPDKDAEITSKAQAAILSRDLNHPNWKYNEQADKLFHNIFDEKETLLKEVRSLFAL